LAWAWIRVFVSEETPMNKPFRSIKSSMVNLPRASRFRSLEERIGIVGFAAALIFAMAHSLCVSEGRGIGTNRWEAAIITAKSVGNDDATPSQASLRNTQSFVEAMANGVGGHRN
jgi:hypothetical protein